MRAPSDGLALVDDTGFHTCSQREDDLAGLRAALLEGQFAGEAIGVDVEVDGFIFLEKRFGQDDADVTVYVAHGWFDVVYSSEHLPVGSFRSARIEHRSSDRLFAVIDDLQQDGSTGRNVRRQRLQNELNGTAQGIKQVGLQRLHAGNGHEHREFERGSRPAILKWPCLSVFVHFAQSR